MKYERPTVTALFLVKEDILSLSDDYDVDFGGLAPDGSGMGDTIDFSDIYKKRTIT